MKTIRIVMIIIIIIVFLIICCVYFNLQQHSEIINYEEYTWKTERLEKIGHLRSNPITLKDNEICVVYGNIPQDYLYWNFDVFNTCNKCQHSISMGKYQSAFPGTNICLLISRNHHLITETKKMCEKNHYERFPNRRLIFEMIPYSESIFLFFETCFRNCDEKIPDFGFAKYTYDCKTFSPFSSFPSYEEYYLPSTNEKRSKVLQQYIADKFSSAEWQYIPLSKVNFTEYHSSNTIVNISKVMDVSYSRTICVVALDHFMSRSAIHSHLLFVNADTSEVLYVYFTGLISKRINTITCKTFHTVEYTPSANVK